MGCTVLLLCRYNAMGPQNAPLCLRTCVSGREVRNGVAPPDIAGAALIVDLSARDLSVCSVTEVSIQEDMVYTSGPSQTCLQQLLHECGAHTWALE